ncbi:outer membrane lipoprotein LolB [Luteibacter rhizovicinus]|uniref:Outer-membrane lipoprotein LolB n=1 Tax=Luteibacter rhizovicinus TaxID=242606 RepID=A0A4R3YIH4_9GAMM|nr:lipoprotein insertase outer membrane protein LolB [Luteibacter rhizovicinus]TCV91842.1 outer membrane lipoprotein LolB [Luteibacter rhizovicinus]
MRLRFVVAALPLMFLAACTAPIVRQQGDAAMLGAQESRERALAGKDRWTVEGKLSVSNGQDGGSGTLVWHQSGDRYEFTVRGPVTGKSFRLSGGPEGAELEGLDGGPQRGADAESLMARTLGWQLPMRDLRAWVLGLRADSGAADIAFGADRLPSRITQDGWQVDYRAWDATRDPALPLKVFAERPPYKVRLSIESWKFD